MENEQQNEALRNRQKVFWNIPTCCGMSKRATDTVWCPCWGWKCENILVFLPWKESRKLREPFYIPEFFFKQTPKTNNEVQTRPSSPSHYSCINCKWTILHPTLYIRPLNQSSEGIGDDVTTCSHRQRDNNENCHGNQKCQRFPLTLSHHLESLLCTVVFRKLKSHTFKKREIKFK